MCNKHFVHLVKVKGDYFWLSGSDIGREGEYVWMTTGQPLTYTHWLHDEPNNYVHFGAKEHCLSFKARGENKWNDRLCTDRYYFICDNQLWCWSVWGFIVELNTLRCCNCCRRRMVWIPNSLCVKGLSGLRKDITLISFLEHFSLWYTSKQPRSDEDLNRKDYIFYI